MGLYEAYNEYLYRKADQKGIPLSGTFELTSRCNLDCKMCYIHARANDTKVIQKEWSKEQWIGLASQCRQMGMLHLLLTGGEPFIRKDFREIYTACREMGLLVSINSNATMIDDGTIEFLKENPPTRINITLYGTSADTYQKLCGNASAYDRVIETILKLKNAGIIVKLNFTATNYNKQDAEGVYAFAQKHSLAFQMTSYNYPPIRACENGFVATERMSPEESARVQIAYDRFRFTPEQLHLRLKSMLVGKYMAEAEECIEVSEERIRCRAGSSTFWVTWDGKMRPCGMMTYPSVDITQESFETAWQQLRKAREEIHLPQKCASCKVANACIQCSAVCYAETGEFTSEPKYMCQRTAEYLKLAHSILQSAEV